MISHNLSGLSGLPLADIDRQLQELYTSCSCHTQTELPNLSDADDMISEMMKDAEIIWKNNGLYPGTINPKVVHAMATKLWDGAQEGYGLRLSDLDPDSVDAQVLVSIQKNVWQFAGAKNYHDLRAMGELLIGEDGNIRSKSDFVQKALQKNTTALRPHLEAEHNLAVIGGQMNAKWQEIQADKDLFPFLEFDAILDEQTTSICRPLDGIVLPVDHVFWDTYYPPNHYNCRTTARKKTSGSRDIQKVPSADVPQMFQTNIGKSQLVFPDGHPFWTDIPAEVLIETMELLSNYNNNEA